MSYYLKVKHPTAITGNFSLLWKGDVLDIKISESCFELPSDNAEDLAKSEELIRYLVDVEGFKDVSNRKPADPEKIVERKSNETAWDMKSPNAKDDAPISGTIACHVRRKGKIEEVRLDVEKNIVHVEDPAVRDELLSQGFIFSKIYEGSEDKSPGEDPQDPVETEITEAPVSLEVPETSEPESGSEENQNVDLTDSPTEPEIDPPAAHSDDDDF